MPLIDIQARFYCDGCGKPFRVNMEPPYEPPAGWSLFDCAVDAVRGSVGYQGPNDPRGFGGLSGVEDEKCLCGCCMSTPAPERSETR